MKISPIIFSTPMVSAILEGRKTVTRRVVKPRTPEDFALLINMEAGIKVSQQIAELIMTSCPYGEIGDILWVRESFNELDGEFYYKASTEFLEDSNWGNEIKRVYDSRGIPLNKSIKDIVKWKPSIHMPKAAARLFLKITGIRVERLQEISEEDARAEGVKVMNGDFDEPADEEDQAEMRGWLIDDNSPDGMFTALGFKVPTKKEREHWKKSKFQN